MRLTREPEMGAADSTLTYVDVEALKHLAQGLTFDLPRCALVLDGALISLNEQNGLPDRMPAWIRIGGLASGASPVKRRGRIIVDITQTMNADRQRSYSVTVLCKSDERETAPVAFFSMHSPTLDVPMRVEVPLRALMVGNPPLVGSYTLYIHALIINLDETYVYYGITKRGWNNGIAFQAYVDQVLVPDLRPGDVVTMDNVGSHKRPGIRAAIEAVGASLLYLPPYSPDFNPIENAFAKLKAMLRKAAARTIDGLWSAIGGIIDTFNPTECANYFSAAGYDPP